MKSTIVLAAAATVALAALPGHAKAEAAYAISGVNMRAGPGPDYPVVTTLGANADVEIFACLEGRSWCDVGSANGRGWVSGDYLAYASDGTIVDQGTAEVPVTTYEPGPYWDSHYKDRDFYAQRGQYIDRDYGTAATTTTATTTTTGGNAGGALSGAATGAAVGAVVGGPVGAAVGGAVGGITGAAIDPPQEVRTYVTQNQVEPATVQGQVQVGTGLPQAVVLHRVPDYQYEYTYVNGQPVLVDPSTRQIVYVYR